MMFKVLILLLWSSVAFAQRTIVLTDRNMAYLDQAFDSESTNKVVEKIQTLSNRWPIYLVLITPGGEIVSGLEMIDNLRGISKNIHTISIFSASMGFSTVQSLGRRYITKHGVLMSHRASGGMKGQFPNGELESRLLFWNTRINNLDIETVARTKGILTLEQYQKMIVNELWCEGKDCVNLGLADEVVNVRCSTSLLGKTQQSINLTFLGQSLSLTIERSNCPLIQGYSLVEQKLGDKPYTRTSPEFNAFIDTTMDKFNSRLLK